MVRLVTLAASILTLASTASAQPSLTPPIAPRSEPASPEPEVTSYRDYILLTSGIGIGLLIGGGMAEAENGRDTDTSDSLYAIGITTTLVAPAFVHFVHRELGRGVGSIGMRAGFAFLGGIVAASTSSCDSEADPFCKLDRIGPGALVGVTVASLVDAFFMSEQRRYREPAYTPVFAASSDGGQVGLAGTF